MSGYTANYSDSHALVVGVNKYSKAGPLSFCVSDAEAVAAELITAFGFPAANVAVLLDGAATRAAILESFLKLSRDGTKPNDRVVFFFAGHGHTETMPRGGESGFLVPVDGDIDNLATMLRWDELTRNAGLIEAKHILFLMDACYGGLAVTRRTPPGAARFLKDLLKRSSRQVLTAGKADQVVADEGGPLARHSPFTGHLLEALRGKAMGTNKILTANGVMSYVYQAVGGDPNVAQTPHFGQIEGDGDMIFIASGVLDGTAAVDPTIEEDQLVAVPIYSAGSDDGQAQSVVEQAKTYLAGDHHAIRLHELVGQEVRRVVSLTAEDKFPLGGAWDPAEFLSRLDRYDVALGDLPAIEVLIGRWGGQAQRSSLLLAVKRLIDQNKSVGGNQGYLALRWYPALVLLYASGIGAVSDGRYDALRDLFNAPIADEIRRSGRVEPLIVAVVDGSQDVISAFNKVPGFERRVVPRSEYLHSRLQPIIDDALFLGADYEAAFDRFEMFLALHYAHLAGEQFGRCWGPPGRFGWKSFRGGQGVYQALAAEAQAAGEAWAPVRAGLFGGTLTRFLEVHERYLESLRQSSWT